MIEVHKNNHHQRSFERRDDQTNGGIHPVKTVITKIECLDGRHQHSHNGEEEEKHSNKEIELLCLLNFCN